jgi:hypothetical protein
MHVVHLSTSHEQDDPCTIANFVDLASSRDDDDDTCDSSTKSEDFMVVKLNSKFNLITNSSQIKK